MTVLQFANNAQTTLAGPITNTATSLNVSAGTGVLFPTPGAGQGFKLTLVSAATVTITEIMLVTSVSGDTFTVTRAQEGTVALNWLAGDLVYNWLTAGTLQSLAQSSALASSFYEGTDTGSANAVNVPTLNPALSTPVSGDVFVIVKGASGNAGAVAMQINGGTSYAVVYKDGSGLNSGDWPSNSAAMLFFTGAVYQFVANQSNINSLIAAQPSISPPRNLVSHIAAGSGNFTVPANITWVYYTVVGAGGGGGPGGGGGFSDYSGGGGGSGGYSAGWLAVTPAQVIPYVVGAGGAGSAVDGTYAGSGGTSSFNTTVTATGGGGGVLTLGVTASGGVYGIGGGGQANLPGGSGGDGNDVVTQIQGGAGAPSALGGGGRTSTVGLPGRPDIINGVAPGSGGGGVWGTGTGNQQGGNGADGAVIIQY